MAFPKLNLPFGKNKHAATTENPNGTAATTTTHTGTTTTTAGNKAAGAPKWLVIVRALQLLLAIIILGLSAYEINWWRNNGCSSPARVNFNIAAAVISFVFIAYHVLAALHILPAIVFAQIPMDFIMFLFFIIAAGIGKYTYNDVYNNCGAIVYVPNTKRDLFTRMPKGGGGRGGGGRSGGRGSGDGDVEGDKLVLRTTRARQGLDVILGLLFLVTLALTAFFALKGGNLFKKKHTEGTAMSPNTAAPAAGGYPQTTETHQGGYPPQNQGYGAAPQQYPQTTGGTYPPQQQQTGYPPQADHQYPQTTGGTYPPQQQHQQGYPPQGQQPYDQPNANYQQPQTGYAAPGTEHKMA